MPDGPSAIVPNSRIWGQTIVNLSVTHQNRRRFDQQNGSSYSDDIDKALAILRGIAADERRILKDPAPLIQVESLGDSSVNILLRVWTARADWLATQMELVQRYKVGLEGGGISLPFPQRDVHHFDAQGGTARSSSAAGQT